MDLDDLITANDPARALEAARGLLDLAESDPDSRRLAWRLVIEICRQQAFVASAAHHFVDCVGCAWCTVGVPEPSPYWTSEELETTSSLRSEG